MKKNLYLAFAAMMVAPLSAMAQIPPQTQSPNIGNNPTLGIQNESSAPSDAIESNWKGCAKDDDCVIIGHSCFVDSVNEEFERDAERDFEDKNKETKCNSDMDQPDNPQAVCTNSICTIQY